MARGVRRFLMGKCIHSSRRDSRDVAVNGSRSHRIRIRTPRASQEGLASGVPTAGWSVGAYVMVVCRVDQENTRWKPEKSSRSIGAQELAEALSGCDLIDVTDFSVSPVIASRPSAYCAVRKIGESSPRTTQSGGRVRGGAAGRPSRSGTHAVGVGARGGASPCPASCARARAFPANEAARANV
jgi:hypothetical protein